MNKIFTYAVGFCSFLALFSCSIKTIVLPDNATEVPRDSTVLKGRQAFTNDSRIISYDAIYVQASSSRDLYGIYRFYSNGQLNLFFNTAAEVEMIFKQSDSLNNRRLLDPQFTGHRGRYIIENSKISGELYAEKDDRGNTGKLKQLFIFSSDSLLVKTNSGEKGYSTVYIKRKLPAQYLNVNGFK